MSAHHQAPPGNTTKAADTKQVIHHKSQTRDRWEVVVEHSMALRASKNRTSNSFRAADAHEPAFRTDYRSHASKPHHTLGDVPRSTQSAAHRRTTARPSRLVIRITRQPPETYRFSPYVRIVPGILRTVLPIARRGIVVLHRQLRQCIGFSSDHATADPPLTGPARTSPIPELESLLLQGWHLPRRLEQLCSDVIITTALNRRGLFIASETDGSCVFTESLIPPHSGAPSTRAPTSASAARRRRERYVPPGSSP